MYDYNDLADGQDGRQFHSSTPIKPFIHSNASSLSRPADSAHLASLVRDLQLRASELGLENEELQTELNQMRADMEQLKAENAQLLRELREKEAIQAKMGEQLETVTKTTYTLFEKFCAFKRWYYQEHRSEVFGLAANGR